MCQPSFPPLIWSYFDCEAVGRLLVLIWDRLRRTRVRWLVPAGDVPLCCVQPAYSLVHSARQRHDSSTSWRRFSEPSRHLEDHPYSSVVVLEDPRGPIHKSLFLSLGLLSLSLDHKVLENCQGLCILQVVFYVCSRYSEEWLTYWYQILLTQ